MLFSFLATIFWMALGAAIGVLIFISLFTCGIIKADDITWNNFLQKLENIRKNRDRNIE